MHQLHESTSPSAQLMSGERRPTLGTSVGEVSSMGSLYHSQWRICPSAARRRASVDECLLACEGHCSFACDVFPPQGASVGLWTRERRRLSGQSGGLAALSAQTQSKLSCPPSIEGGGWAVSAQWTTRCPALLLRCQGGQRAETVSAPLTASPYRFVDAAASIARSPTAIPPPLVAHSSLSAAPHP